MTKRLQSRLNRLSESQGGTITRDDLRLLVSILGRRDALFWPWRWTLATRPPMAEIKQRQAEYLAGSVGIAARADGSHRWKSAQQGREHLIAAGLATARHSSGQVQSMFLTARGEAMARALVGDRLHTVKSGLVVLTYLTIKSQQTTCRAVRESVLFCRELVGNPEDWDSLTEHILPYLVCGMVEANSDTQGRACYTPVDSVSAPEAVELQVSADPDFDDAYVSAFNSERHVLQTCEPRDTFALYIPLPATGWGWPCHFKEATTNEAE